MTFSPARARMLSAAICVAAFSAASASLALDDTWQGPDLGNWTDTANWNQGFAPNRDPGYVGVINNNTTAVVNSNVTGANGPAGIVLGTVVTTDIGGLTIQNGGTLSSQPGDVELGGVTVGLAGTGTVTVNGGGSFLPQNLVLGRVGTGVGTVTVQNGGSITVTDAVQVGLNGRGTLNVLGGGTVTATRLNSGGTTGATASLIALGDASGLTATVTLSGPTSLLRTTQVTGPNVNFTSTGALTLPNSHTLVADIRNAATHSALKTPSSASVAGTLKLQFGPGITPALGNAWTLINAGSISGAFNTIDSSLAPLLAPGQSYQTRKIAGGNGKLLQVAVEQLLTLQVNRLTGALSIKNAGGSAAAGNVDIDSYTVTSANGGLNGANGIWSSLSDQAVAAWQEITPTTTNLTEINPTTTTLFAGGQSRAIGAPYTRMFPAFRTEPDDVTFSYTTANGTRTGLVEYIGTKVTNNLVISVDPTTGATTLKNDSPFNVSIEGYSIFSAMGSLRPANGQWNSLTDQGTPNWNEASPTSTVLSELAITGSLLLPAQSTKNLGTLFNPAGVRDLTFEFIQLNAANSVPGVVQYAYPADFDRDGDVDGPDLEFWKTAFGVNTNGNADGDADSDGFDFLTWQRQIGSKSATAVAASVPEPASWLLSIFAGALVCGQARRRRTSAVTPATRSWRTCMQTVQARRALVGALAGLAAWCATVGSGERAQAADILLVTRPAQFGASDQELITLLKSFGHTIVNEGAVALNNASFTAAPPTAAQLQNVDLILFSRNNNSPDTSNGTEPAQWNALNVPLLSLAPPILRGATVVNTNSRWGWVNSTANIDNAIAPTDVDAFPDPLHPFVTGRTTSVYPPGQTIDYLNFTAAEMPTGTTLVATMTIGANVVPLIADYPAGTLLFADLAGTATTTTARRAFFLNYEYPDTTDVFGFTTNGGQILNQMVTAMGGAASTHAGDVDGNGVVDPFDLAAIKANFRTTVVNRISGDLTGDGFVDIADFREWKENDGLLSGGSGSGVPEPSAALLAAFGMAGAMLRRRRR
jgi:T5SS/PEP-CTERM-associated repeat protein